MDQIVVSRKCRVCYRNASCFNYGALCCGACKMFFRRIAVLNRSYTCQNNGQCYTNYTVNSPLPECRACRYERCLNAGMRIVLRPGGLRTNDGNCGLTVILEQLMTYNAKRLEMLRTECTLEDPNLEEIVERNQLRVVKKDSSHRISLENWSFYCTYTTIGYLLNFEFLDQLEQRDRKILIKYFSIRLTFAFIALQSMSDKSDKLITFDGEDALPEVLSNLFEDSPHLCRLLRSFLISRLIDKRVKNEEFLLLTAVLFCNPALPSLSENARGILGSEQKKYTDALLQHCFLHHPHSAPSRFSDLLSLCHAINKNFESIQYVTMIFQMNKPDYKLHKLVESVRYC